MKIDLRILILSLLIHVMCYYILDFDFLKKQKTINDSVEIEIRDEQPKNPQRHRPAKIVDISKSPKIKEVETLEPAPLVSQNEARYKKQSISKYFGPIKTNEAANPLQKKSDTSEKMVDEKMKGFFPLPSSISANQDARRSSVPFEVPHLAKGDLTFLNSDFSSFATFYARITPQIVNRWSQNVEEISIFPHMIEKLSRKVAWRTRLELILTSQGQIENIIIINTSGSDELDGAIVQSLREAAPFLNPPTGMIESDGRVHITGEFSVYTQRSRLAK